MKRRQIVRKRGQRRQFVGGALKICQPGRKRVGQRIQAVVGAIKICQICRKIGQLMHEVVGAIKLCQSREMINAFQAGDIFIGYIHAGNSIDFPLRQYAVVAVGLV